MRTSQLSALDATRVAEQVKLCSMPLSISVGGQTGKIDNRRTFHEHVAKQPCWPTRAQKQGIVDKPLRQDMYGGSRLGGADFCSGVTGTDLRDVPLQRLQYAEWGQNIPKGPRTITDVFGSVGMVLCLLSWAGLLKRYVLPI